jgi:nucleotide-binding universal stress UspA family protein
MFQRIVLAVDGWDQAKGAVAAASDLAAKSSGEVLVVHVHDTGLVSREVVDLQTRDGSPGLVEAAVEVPIRKVAHQCSRLRVNRSACVAEGILRAAADFGGDTIVLGLRAPEGFVGRPLGSVAHRVIQRAACPVVVVCAAGASPAEKRRAAGRAVTAA